MMVAIVKWRAGRAAEERDAAGADGEDDEALRRERLDEPAGSEQRRVPALKTQIMIPKVAKSKIELIGPKKVMKRRMKPVSQCAGRWSCSSSTLSVGIVISLAS